VRLSTVSGSVIRDTRKPDAVDPAEGGLIGLDGELAARRIGSESRLLQNVPAGIYVPPRGSSRTIAAFGARVGMATGFERTITHDR